jgi:hypothetical protein
MLIKTLSAFDKIRSLVTASLLNMEGITMPRFKYLSTTFELWLSLPVRFTFLNLSRFGLYSDKSNRLHFEKDFDFAQFNDHVISSSCGKNLIAAFDPSYIPKSGKATPGLGRYWSGKDQRAIRGLEISCLALIDVEAQTAMPLETIQTPSKEEMRNKGINLIGHYVSLIDKQKEILVSKVEYLVVDGYFMKKEFINPILEFGLQVITKMRPDANLRYAFKGHQKKGRGRPRLYDEKVDCRNIDKRRIRKFDEDEHTTYYSGQVYCVTLKRLVTIVYIQDKKTGKHEIFISTDTNMDASLILQYYRLRFQIEFLIRDAKQFTGLEECQARGEKKLYFHFNMAFSAVGVAKAATWLNVEKSNRESFSMRNIKLLYYNKFITERIFSNLGVDMNCRKIKKLYRQCLEIGNLAA